MWLQFAYDHAGQFSIVPRVEGHKTELCPLIEKIPVHIDAVGFGKILRYQLANLREVLGLFVKRILDISYAGGMALEVGAR